MAGYYDHLWVLFLEKKKKKKNNRGTIIPDEDGLFGRIEYNVSENREKGVEEGRESKITKLSVWQPRSPFKPRS